MKKAYYNSATGEVFESDDSLHGDGIFVKEGDDWVQTAAGKPVKPEAPEVKSSCALVGKCAAVALAVGLVLLATPAREVGWIVIVVAVLTAVAAIPQSEAEKKSNAGTSSASQPVGGAARAARPMEGWVSIGWGMLVIGGLLVFTGAWLLAGSLAGSGLFVLLIAHAARSIAEAQAGRGRAKE